MMSDLGSSLRVQGGQTLVAHGDNLRGFIPARAGRTDAGRRGDATPWVHPCACRADQVASVQTLARRGSSLRVQGGPCLYMSAVRSGRFIPARAGRTGADGPEAPDSQVHPCACRADALTIDTPRASKGSSLRVQGGPMRGRARPTGERFIPARAGRTHRRASPSVASGVHPCACRADPLAHGRRSRAGGSSLRVQGRADPLAHGRRSRAGGSSLRVQGGPACPWATVKSRGFIPARAGRTRLPMGDGQEPGVHPCACRADPLAHGRRSRAGGSSLRVQGGPACPWATVKSRGFIPARAGRTGLAGRPCRARQVHPCACRADDRAKSVLFRAMGSSLRVQGGHRVLLRRRGILGFIPARAGRTRPRGGG